MTDKISLPEIEHTSRWPVSNNPNNPNNAVNRKRYVINGLLQCIHCMEWKKLDEYHKARNMMYGVCALCKTCACAKRKEHYYKKKAQSPYRDEDGNLIKKPEHTLRRKRRKDIFGRNGIGEE